ncbi:MAG: hypothetical protein U1E27_13725 [Kiritimatiellia bacterium]|nr:hypothetical protein [Kiritimatiellia bacterium]
METFQHRVPDSIRGIATRAWVGRIVMLLLGVMVLLTGCDKGGGEKNRGPSPGRADLRGKWVGAYFHEDKPSATWRELTATIVQDGNSIILRTSLSGMGGLFTGSMNSDGNLELTDAHDGETWTTALQFVPTASRVQIADFLRTPTLEDPVVPKQIIDLRRP